MFKLIFFKYESYGKPYLSIKYVCFGKLYHRTENQASAAKDNKVKSPAIKLSLSKNSCFWEYGFNIWYKFSLTLQISQNLELFKYFGKRTELKTLELETLNPDRLIWISTVETFNLPLLLGIYLHVIKIRLITNTDKMLYRLD